jgi:MoxR-like ATPase
MAKAIDRNAFFSAVKEVYGDITSITRTQIVDLCASRKLTYPQWLTADPAARVGRGVYAIDASGISSPVIESNPLMQANMAVAAVVPIRNEVSFVPEKANGYVPFGCFSDVRSIIKSQKFYPIYITGLSGNGKTMIVEQVCAVENRECIRVNITIETDEDDLIGGFRLVDGKTVWHDGPVIQAMQRGAILLLDEVDLGSNKMMCLQPVLEGKQIYIKKTNRVISPAPGFNVVATANTKGKGSDDGRFIGTNVMNEAFLERFSVTMEQEYPNARTESKILMNVLKESGLANSEEFVNHLVSWAEVIRKSFAEGAVSDVISTRRLVHICEAAAIFRNREKAVTMCLNRFDTDTKNSFLDLFKKLDPTDTTAQAMAPVSETTEFAF